MDGERRRSRLRTFALGSLLGAAAGSVAAARSRSPVRRRPRAVGPALGAFEDAPCFLELVEEEAQRYREAGGETSSGASKLE
ncbi:MAG TPA: hypothetical protein VF186_08660 [Gaiellaceae bacterium]|jgi:hypothetical protein